MLTFIFGLAVGFVFGVAAVFYWLISKWDR